LLDYYQYLSQLGYGKIATAYYDDQAVLEVRDERRYLEANQDNT